MEKTEEKDDPIANTIWQVRMFETPDGRRIEEKALASGKKSLPKGMPTKLFTGLRMIQATRKDGAVQQMPFRFPIYEESLSSAFAAYDETFKKAFSEFKEKAEGPTIVVPGQANPLPLSLG